MRPCERGLDLRLAERSQADADRPVRGDCGEALLRPAAVPFEMTRNQGLNRPSIVRVQVSTVEQVFGQGPRLVARPGVECGDELGLLDQTVL